MVVKNKLEECRMSNQLLFFAVERLIPPSDFEGERVITAINAIFFFT